MTDTPAGARLRRLIEAEGPVDVARFMALALADPEHGYYPTRDPLGAGGDFTTAPEISQLFGELCGLWAAHAWTVLGRPGRVALVELGPGRGTLMADALRAARAAAPDFAAALRLHLVETSPVLRRAQAERLRDAKPEWHDGVETLPDGPRLTIANEFFDALPVRQLVRQDGAWHERLVGLRGEGFAFGLAPLPTSLSGLPEARDGSVLELPEAGAAVMARLARAMAHDGGALLAIDYGHVESGFGDTLQAVVGHATADPLERIGEADLTTHVDFAALARVGVREGARIDILATQADVLEGLGIGPLAARRERGATPAQAEALRAGVARLVDRAPRGMGSLFKVLALSGGPVPVSAPAG